MRNHHWNRRRFLRLAGGTTVASLAAASTPAGGAAAAGVGAGTSVARSAGATGCSKFGPGTTLVDLGAPLPDITIMRAAFGVDATGRSVMYLVPAGENAALNIIDTHTHQRLAAIPLPGARGSWAITTDPSGAVYIGAYSNAHLYRYDPTSQTVSDLGAPIAGEAQVYGLSSGPDGTIYGGTYPNCHAFAYDPDTDTVTDFGRVDTESRYVRAAVFAADQDALIAGVFSPVPKLVRIDVGTGAMTDITPPGMIGVGVNELGYAGGIVFAALDGVLYAVDAVTGQQQSFTDAETGTTHATMTVGSRFISEVHHGSIYLSGSKASGRELRKVDLASLTSSIVRTADGTPITLGAGGQGFGLIEEDGDTILYGKVGTSSGLSFTYNLDTQSYVSWTGDVLPDYAPLAHILVGEPGSPHADQVIISGYLGGATAVYDNTSGTFDDDQPKLGQVEGWCWHDDSVIAGVYPTATIKQWDPSGGADPAALFSLQDGHQQNRPFAVITVGTTIYTATLPDYGEHGGALSVYDLTTSALTVHRNIVPDQAIAALTSSGPLIYGGSAIQGGGGTDPIAAEAKLFAFDPITATKVGEWTAVPGANTINEVSVGPDGHLWGLADGTVFSFDPVSEMVVSTVTMYSGTTGGHGGEMVWHPNGLLYVTSRYAFYSVDPVAGTSALVQSGVERASLAGDGSIYLTYQPAGGLARTNLARFTPGPRARHWHARDAAAQTAGQGDRC